MRYIIRYFPEITLKSRPVRMRLVSQLKRNLRQLLGGLDKRIHIQSAWDRLDLSLPDEAGCRRRWRSCWPAPRVSPIF